MKTLVHKINKEDIRIDGKKVFISGIGVIGIYSESKQAIVISANCLGIFGGSIHCRFEEIKNAILKSVNGNQTDEPQELSLRRLLRFYEQAIAFFTESHEFQFCSFSSVISELELCLNAWAYGYSQHYPQPSIKGVKIVMEDNRNFTINFNYNFDNKPIITNIKRGDFSMGKINIQTKSYGLE